MAVDRARLVAALAAAVAGATACPPDGANAVCDSSSDCASDEECVLTDGAGACKKLGGEGEGEGEGDALSLAATPRAINAGQDVTIEYDVLRAVDAPCVLSENGEALASALDGAPIVRTPTTSATYALVCGAESAAIEVPVSRVALGPGAVKAIGEDLTLSFTVEEIEDGACSSPDGVVALADGAGTFTVTRDTGGDVTLTCAGANGAIVTTRAVSVLGVSAPAIADAGAPIVFDVAVDETAVCTLSSTDLSGDNVRDELASEVVSGDARTITTAGDADAARIYTVSCTIDGSTASATNEVLVRPAVRAFDGFFTGVPNDLGLSWDLALPGVGSCTFDDGDGGGAVEATGSGTTVTVAPGPATLTVKCELDASDPSPSIRTLRVHGGDILVSVEGLAAVADIEIVLGSARYSDAGTPTPESLIDLGRLRKVEGEVEVTVSEQLTLVADELEQASFIRVEGGDFESVRFPKLQSMGSLTIDVDAMTTVDLSSLDGGGVVEVIEGDALHLLLPAAHHLSGVRIENTIGELTLDAPQLESLESLTLRNNDGATALSLAALVDGGAVSISSYAMTEVSLPNLASATSLFVDVDAATALSFPSLTVVAGELRVQGCTSLVSLSFPALAGAGAIALENTDALTTVDFSALQQAGDISLVGFTTLADADFASLTRAGNVSLNGTGAFPLALPALTRADGLLFSGVVVPTSLPALTRVDGSVILSGYGAPSFTAPALGSIGGAFIMQSSVAAVLSLANLTTITDAFTIAGSAVDTMTFTDLTRVGGEFSVLSAVNLTCAEVAALYCPLVDRDATPQTANVGGQPNCNTTVHNGC